MKSIAIVIPWFDSNLTGGAERQAFQIATRLAARGHRVEVLTTCSESFASDWSVNHYLEGQIARDALTIRRFRVDARDSEAFDRVNAKLLRLEINELKPGINPLTSDEASIFCSENIKSSALLNYLKSHQDSYDRFIFLPYMFQASTSGALMVGERAWLQPCLHNEPAAYLPQIAEMFRGVSKVLFNSMGERELALELFGPGIITRSEIVGEGIEAIAEAAELPSELRDTRFLLYLGRRESVKNLPMLLDSFAAFRNRFASSMLLVLAGSGSDRFDGPGVLDLGLVTEETKAALLRSAIALVQPSLNESFSRVMMESWSVGRPVVVHSLCRPTAEAVHQSGGGWAVESKDEWVQTFHQIDQASPEELAQIGERGRGYAEENANWDRVIDRYERLLELNESQTSGPTKQAFAIHQLLPDMVYGDAISNQALAIRDRLRSNGYESEIFVKRREKRMSESALLFDEVQPEADAGLFYHHSIGSELTAAAVSHPGPKCLIYHNITPAEYFEPYRPGFAWMLETGRASLKRLAPHFNVSVGDSAYNARELAANGFKRPGVLPIVIGPDRWNIAPAQNQLTRLLDGRHNILFTGRIAPNKKQDRLVEAFSHYLKLDPKARLIIAGEGRASDPYFHLVLDTINRLKLESAVELTGNVEEETLLAYYRTAHLYWSFSEHEGFGAPLVEAMWFDIPVFACGGTAVTETLDTAGELFDRGDDLTGLAHRAFELITVQPLRESVIKKQRIRRESFTPLAVWPILAELIDRLQSESLHKAVA